MRNRQPQARSIALRSGLIPGLILGLLLSFGGSGPAHARGNPKQTLKKLGAYIYGLNRLSSDVRRSYRFYTQSIKDRTTGPTGKERSITLLAVRAKTACKAIRRASRKRPRLRTLDKAGKKYCHAAYQLQKMTPSLSSYYRTHGYRLDGGAKGRRAHPKLMKAFREFLTADAIISKEVARIQVKVYGARRRQIRRRYGKNMRFYHYIGPKEARKALHVARREQNAQTPDPRQVIQAAQSLEHLVATMNQVALKHDRKAIRSGFRSYVTYMRLFSRELTRYAQKLKRKGAKRANYFYKKLFGAFNQMIAHANRVHFKRGMR